MGSASLSGDSDRQVRHLRHFKPELPFLESEQAPFYIDSLRLGLLGPLWLFKRANLPSSKHSERAPLDAHYTSGSRIERILSWCIRLVRVEWALWNCYKSFGMMVARDGVEPPTPAFSELRSAVLLTT